ncbi:MAG: hypothetical protein ACRD0S_03535 [Acidimicrobiales bacterium]
MAAGPVRSGSLRQALPCAGLVIGVWAAVTPYVLLGDDLNALAKNEFADHVVPGALMIGLSVAQLLRDRKGVTGGTYPLLAGFGVALAGLWMTATHLPLVSDASDGVVEEKVAAWHTIPGLVVLVLGAVWAVTCWSGAEEPAQRS